MALAPCFVEISVADEPASLEYYVRQMLDEGWGIEPSARANAEEHFRKAIALAPGDRRVYVARSLTLTKQGRYDLALEAWRRMSESEPENLDFLAWKIRTRIISKQHSAALVDMLAMAEKLSDNGAADDATQQDAMQRANFLGRMFGYIDGPGNAVAKTTENHRAESRRAIVAALTAQQQQAFEEGRATVTDRAVAFELEQQQEREQGIEVQQAERLQRAEQLVVEQNRVTLDMQNLDEDLRRVRADQRDEIREIERSLSGVESQLAQYESRLLAARDEIHYLRREINTLIIALDAEEDEFRRRRLRDDIRRLELLLSRRDADYRIHEREAIRINDQRLSLQREGQRINQLYDNQAKDIERRGNALRKLDRRLRNEQLEVQRPPTGVNARVRYLQSKATSFNSYDQFPLEREKAVLLESFRNQ
ncbi:MAG: hypothetical protein WD030_02075 [Pirellulales bacterium]